MRLGKSFLNDFGGKAVNLKVHLNCGNTLLCSCNLEVHIAVEILKALDVNHSHKVAVNAFIACNKAAGNACNGGLNRNAGSHKSKR